MSKAVHRSPNKLWRSNFIYNLWYCTVYIMAVALHFRSAKRFRTRLLGRSSCKVNKLQKIIRGRISNEQKLYFFKKKSPQFSSPYLPILNKQKDKQLIWCGVNTYTVSWRIRIFNCIEEVPRFFFPIEFNPTFQISNYLQFNCTPYTI